MSTLTFPILWKDAHERGIKGVIELSMSDLPLKGARVRDLFPVLNTKINAKFPFERNSREVETFLLYGTRVSRDRSLKALIPELRSCPRFVVSMRLYPNWAPRSSIRIFIKTLTDRIILINCETTDTVVCLKSRIRDKEGIAPDVQSLVFAGKELENHLSLRTYGIKNLSQVHLVRLMRGGGGPPRMFADVSDDWWSASFHPTLRSGVLSAED
ncbi:Ubiquitin family [Phytophthora infestans]|uniref:Ubiquitin family n=1 Tax=Phytophthora infestans TaxID=4787 RepID=A0A833T8P0_PHYIN|nr:Ubiquitin family [Phytophthora infestans]KAF4130500.1 Ubiquitin family [Phytophthora infestans]